MSYTEPTTADLKAKFTVFSAVSDDDLQAALDDAALMVDDTWASQADFTTGRLLLAAHYLTLAGLGTSNEAQFGGFKRLKIGSLELERAATSDQEAAGKLGSTMYGQRFVGLLERNRPGPLVV